MKNFMLFLSGMNCGVMIMNMARSEYEIAFYNAIAFVLTLISWRL